MLIWENDDQQLDLGVCLGVILPRGKQSWRVGYGRYGPPPRITLHHPAISTIPKHKVMPPSFQLVFTPPSMVTLFHHHKPNS